jgi:glycine cleavage system aminomethyltransferase T
MTSPIATPATSSRRSEPAASTGNRSGSRSRATRSRSRSRASASPRHDGEAVGTETDLIWSPRLQRNIGYVWVPIGLTKAGTPLEIEAPDGGRWPARTADIPFLDPRKDTPKS